MEFDIYIPKLFGVPYLPADFPRPTNQPMFMRSYSTVFIAPLLIHTGNNIVPQWCAQSP